MMKLYLLFGLTLAILISATLQLSKTGFQLDPQAQDSISVVGPWSGRVWARTQCSTSTGRFSCATADCGSDQVACKCNGKGGVPPATLAEFTIAENGGQDYYDISVKDGCNLPVSITPQGGAGQNCSSISCGANVNTVCPPELAMGVS
ncbi:hypothetical protein V6N13_035109 [Hibiscus sabdariffa]|uniref:Thaumatin-like protein n=1 Tax=Hibiscus sabdariffa TaxID=183260 RepID=A0ABR2NH59_9ROSI